MADSDGDEFPVWRTPEGDPVSCVEKIKVLNENLAELRALAQDALEDAVLMGCDERQVREVLAGIVAGASAFAVIWAALSRTPLGVTDATEHIRLTPEAHGGDVVTVILADFRGFDTMVEITVLTVAVIGAAALLRRGRLW
jgi:multicomponent Na+:H+ antiporter subunit A